VLTLDSSGGVKKASATALTVNGATGAVAVGGAMAVTGAFTLPSLPVHSTGTNDVVTMNSSGVVGKASSTIMSVTAADGAVNIAGNLNVTGEVNQVAVNDITVEDPLILLATSNPGDAYDIGFYGKYVNAGTKYAGLFRDATDGVFRLFADLTSAPTATSAGDVSSVLGVLNMAQLVLAKSASPGIYFGADTTSGLTSNASDTITMNVSGAVQTEWNALGFKPTSGIQWASANAFQTVGGTGFAIVNQSSTEVLTLSEAGALGVASLVLSSSLSGATTLTTSGSIGIGGVDLTSDNVGSESPVAAIQGSKPTLALKETGTSAEFSVVTTGGNTYIACAGSATASGFNNIIFQTGGTDGSHSVSEAMRIDSAGGVDMSNDLTVDGNIGIGVAPSATYPIDVADDAVCRLGTTLVGAWPFNAGDYAFFGNRNIDHTASSGTYALLQTLDGTTLLNAVTGQSLGFRIANGEMMTIDSAGDVDIANNLVVNGTIGVGTSGPIAPLHVQADKAWTTGSSLTVAETQLILSGATDSNKRLEIGFDSTNNYAIIQSHWRGDSFRDLLLNPQGKNVGIATTSPDAKLDILTTGNNHLRFTHTNGSVYSDHYVNSGGHQYNDASGGRFYFLNTSGNDSLTSFQLDTTYNYIVQGATTGVTNTMHRMDTTAAGEGHIDFYDGTTSGKIAYDHATDDFYINVASIKALRIQGHTNCISTFTGAGNLTFEVSSGTRTDLNIIDRGSTFANSDQRTRVIFSDGAASNATIGYYDSKEFLISATASGSSMAFRTGNTERMLIDSSGNVGIGRDPTSTYKLDVFGTLNIGGASGTNDAVLYFNPSGAGYVSKITGESGGNQNLVLSHNSIDALEIDSLGNTYLAGAIVHATNKGVYLNGSVGTTRIYYDTSNLVVTNGTGGVYMGANSTGWTAVSDRRLKNSIDYEAVSGLPAIEGLKPCTFKYNADDEKTNARYGFIAQDVNEQIPHAVSVDPQGYYGVSVTEVIPHLVKAVQELSTQLESARATITTLEGGLVAPRTEVVLTDPCEPANQPVKCALVGGFVRVGGIVSLNGAVSGSIIATLPVSHRPADDEIFLAPVEQGTAELQVGTDGTIVAHFTGAPAWLSLSVISFMTE
jgi:hypothetical protein